MASTEPVRLAALKKVLSGMTPICALRSLSLASALVLGYGIAGANAAALTGEQVLEQFNLVVFGNMQGGHDVEGRALVGGNLTGNSTSFFTKGNQAPASDYKALSVGGNITGGPTNMNNGGSLVVGGNVTKNINMNGGGTAYVGGSVTGGANINGNKVVGQPVTVPNFVAVMNQLSDDLQLLTANATAQVSGNKGTFDASGKGDTVVFNIASGSAFFSSIGEIAFNLGAADTVIINVGGTSMTMNENWLGGVGQSVADNIIWNFYEATSLTFNTEYFGSILAPLALVKNSNALNGSVIANSLQQGGAIRQYPFSGDIPGGETTVGATDVPEPMALGLLGLGLIGLMAAHRRKP